MNVEEAILTRRSVRRFLPKPVPEPVVRKIIEVSARAPSGHNIQPWKVYAIAGEVKDRLCADILKAAETEPDKHRPEYEYYPTEWHEPISGVGASSATTFTQSLALLATTLPHAHRR